MPRDIKFTPFGVPYLLEFEHVSVVPDPRPPSPSSSSSSSSSFCHIDSPPTPHRRPSFSLRSPSSIFKRKPTPARLVDPAGTSNDTKPPPPPPQPDASETNGIHIRFHSGRSDTRMARKEMLVHLQQIISVAVLDAGMSRSPGSNTTLPTEKRSNGNARHLDRAYKTTDALFCGTYGQMMAALERAGLSATPCAGGDLSGYTRLGALFVARNDGASGVQLRKITLWG